MKKEKLQLVIRGKAAFITNGKVKMIKNAIQPQAKEIVAKRLIAHPTSVIDSIDVYNGVNLLSSKPIINKYIVNPQTVGFDSLFDGPSFNGDFTEVRLVASGIGNFSIIINLIDSKLPTDSLLISWEIQIS